MIEYTKNWQEIQRERQFEIDVKHIFLIFFFYINKRNNFFNIIFKKIKQKFSNENFRKSDNKRI